MGCGSSRASDENSTVDKKEKDRCIIKVEVSKVAKIQEEDQEEFKQKYLSNEYLHQNDEGYEERLNNSNEIMFKRWEWLQNNKDIYVNMLRLSNHSDETIQACLDGKKPICYNQETFEELCRDLIQLKKDLESQSVLRNIRYVHTGSSVAAYSSNPLKGFRDRPSKITDKGKSDVDIVIVASNVKQMIEAKKKENEEIVREYPCVCTKEGLTDIRFGMKPKENPHALQDFISKWRKKLGGGIQFTYQDGNPVLPPWELPIKLTSNTNSNKVSV